MARPARSADLEDPAAGSETLGILESARLLLAMLFGAFVAGIVVGSAEGTTGAEAARETIRTFSFAFFIPLYFAIVGPRLDLLDGFELPSFLLFLTVACVRPRIVLASVAFDAGIIDGGSFAVLVMLAIVTSLVAGSWLGRVVRSGEPLR